MQLRTHARTLIGIALVLAAVSIPGNPFVPFPLLPVAVVLLCIALLAV